MSDSKTEANLFCIAIGIGLLVFLVVIVNACSADDWNNGICPNCNVEYQLRAVDRGLHYYVCPNCGNEVARY